MKQVAPLTPIATPPCSSPSSPTDLDGGPPFDCEVRHWKKANDTPKLAGAFALRKICYLADPANGIRARLVRGLARRPRSIDGRMLRLARRYPPLTRRYTMSRVLLRNDQCQTLYGVLRRRELGAPHSRHPTRPAGAAASVMWISKSRLTIACT